MIMNRVESLNVTVLHDLEDEYEIIGELGRGGTSIVYHARDRELGRDVAIKIVGSNQLDESEAAARLAREARVVALLSHPNIVPLLAVRHFSAGLALIMQHIPGRTLKRTIREDGPLPISVVEHVLRDIGAALDYAHRRHIVHRDLKPENIYLDVECGRALLADFGIARTTETESTLTLVGTALGTPAYMSPEQIDGITLDGRSDLYSLGLVAYEMLTARQPWTGCNLYTIIYKQKHDDLPPVTSFRGDVPLYLQRAIDGLLRKDRNQRYGDAAEFLALLPATTTLTYAPPARSEPVPAPSPEEEAPTLRYQRNAVDAVDIGPAPVVEPETAGPAFASAQPASEPEVEEVLAPVALVHAEEAAPPGVVVEQLLAGIEPTVDEDSAVISMLSRIKGQRRYVIAAAILFVVLGATAMTAMIRDGGEQQNRWETIPKLASASAQPIADGAIQPLAKPSAALKTQRPASPERKSTETAAVEQTTVPSVAAPNIQVPDLEPNLKAADFSTNVTPNLSAIKSSAERETEIARAVAPELTNREAVQRALLQYYPALLRENGVTGTVTLSVLIGQGGTVVRSRIDVSSGVKALDQAALKVAQVMRFTAPPGRARDSIWVQLPVKFQVQ